MEFSGSEREAFNTPIMVPSVPSLEDISEYLVKIDDQRWYSNFGPLETKLRSRFAKIWGLSIDLVRTACNATLALQGAIETSPNRSSRWQVPSWTFTATTLALENARVNYDFVDVEYDSWRANFSSDIRNVVDVLPFGDTLDFDRLIDKGIHNIVVDGAASAAALMGTIPTFKGNFALIVSLHATKLLPAGEGAIFVSNSLEWSNRFRSWSNFGFNGYRESSTIGTNAKLSEFGAAIAHASLDLFGETIEKYKVLQKQALRISHSLGIRCHPSFEKGIPSPYWIIVLKDEMQKFRVKEKLIHFGIETKDWWGRGCHANPIFGHLNVSLPVTENIAKCSLGLPMHAFLTDSDFSLIYSALKESY
jgi:dTDP-4-amino-4,6-dideoxygalactose transaminase